MPSGAKKRKAAKKKKDKGGSSATNKPSSIATSDDSNHADSHGDEHLKHHECDRAEFSDHHNSEQNLTDGEEEEVGKEKEEDSRLEEDKPLDDMSSEKGAAVEEGGIQIERIMKRDDEFDQKGSSSRSGSSSSSDDESHAVEKNVELADSAPVVDSVEVVDSIKEEKIQINLGSPISKFENCAEEVPVSVKKVAEESASPAFSSYLKDRKDNGERKSNSFEVNGRLPDTTEDLPPDVKEDLTSENGKKEVINVAAISDCKEYAAFESEEKVAPSYNNPRDYTVKDAEHVKDYNDLGSFDRQPLVASAVQPVQRTSWKGCCGLFELFTGSHA